MRGVLPGLMVLYGENHEYVSRTRENLQVLDVT